MEASIYNKPSICVSSMIDMNVPVEYQFISQHIVDHLWKLKLIGYSEKIKQICLIFMALDPTTYSFRQDKHFWRWKRGVFDMYMNVPDYTAFCNATPLQAKQTVAQLYLKGIKTYLAKRKDIDHQKLYNDVKQVFTEAGLIVET